MSEYAFTQNEFDRLFKLGNKFRRQIPVPYISVGCHGDDVPVAQTQQYVPVGVRLGAQPLTTRYPIAVPVGNPMEGWQLIPYDWFNQGTDIEPTHFINPPPPSGTKRAHDDRDGPGGSFFYGKSIYSAPKRVKTGVFELDNLLTALPDMRKHDLLSLLRRGMGETFAGAYWRNGGQAYWRNATSLMDKESLIDVVTGTFYNPELTLPFHIGLAPGQGPTRRRDSGHTYSPAELKGWARRVMNMTVSE